MPPVSLRFLQTLNKTDTEREITAYIWGIRYSSAQGHPSFPQLLPDSNKNIVLFSPKHVQNEGTDKKEEIKGRW